ncbi:nucleotidyltransferase domain-containing protein [Vibrio sp. SCSIO 43136]|uniref:nucleotidyltransferase domain-containing protein n=1 Tax=Vibrio sp. SCSIO 43136 TaxID=2819101 RepID=UPI002074E99D|nr:nucleotidyltransferase domain-containing protein [Vibrio sp. SCSIO 43136]USD66354.1 nucleotidyltransferase domain-containing protein [Vibrio sp. SCSIO 43136]
MLPTIDPQQPFQAEYAELIQSLKHYLRGGLGSNLHSLYLFGSVARKKAIPGRSNLDIVIICSRELSEKDKSLINTIKWQFTRKYPAITGISVQTATIGDVLTLESIFTWGFMLRHCCVCIEGTDLSDSFGDFEPSWEIAKHWNMDVEEWLSLYRQKIVKAESLQTQVAAQQIIAKKLLRASYSLIMHKDKQWIEDPIECGKQFLKYHPKKRTEVERLVILYSGKPVPKRASISILDDYGRWLVKSYQRTEFRIG